MHFEVWERHRGVVFRHLMARKRAGVETAGHWLDRAEDYDYIRSLVAGGRVRVVKGDLLKKRTLRGIGAAAAQLDVNIRTVYLSNAEEFWRYPRNFRKNIQSLPMDERSVILRLRHNDKFAPRLDGRYAYAVHGGLAFQRDLAKTNEFSLVDHFLRKARVTQSGLMLIEVPTAETGSEASASSNSSSSSETSASLSGAGGL